MSKVTGKNIIITGASSGIGKEIAMEIASKGGFPILVARSVDKLIDLQQMLTVNYSINCSYYVADLTNLDTWENVLADIIFDHKSVDAIVNNAGVGIFNLLEESNWEDTERMIQLNVLSLIKGVQVILPHFLDRKQGHIVNIGSQAGKMSTPKSAVYSASKHAVIGFSNALRLELRNKGIFVTTVNLGPVRTNFFDVADPTGKYKKAVDKYMINPNQVAKQVVKYLFTNKREINLPRWMDAGSKLYQLFPSIVEKLLRKQFLKK
ncbi:SDR family NAD(P)-dependent oxidoreductase [Aquibacillus halophilus]|uniref:SDR family NAD(P)-dependent oxidoreductase n=1 Tax=Aquibacillus halophilus TaxID=930132 RepID=A0A6A8DEX3_9BACI|nr:SDR family oxidoreductase [Aquibacillus halophilus]MRH42321.1 SDR family NAD(P)-dependent oxidoreductase [Aquibacillus halophilus]